ncbi:MAG: hypothetical protein N2170_09815, partial [Bacteroidia bacterium]|nr:hypothetical protein [Bacteroidia bacterium]
MRGYVTFHIEGGLLSPEKLESIAAQRRLPGLPDPLDPYLAGLFHELQRRWERFNQARKERNDSSPSFTREEWVLPLFEKLGYSNISYQRAHLQAGGHSFGISHSLYASFPLPLH